MMNRFKWVIMLFVILVLAACGNDEEPTNPEESLNEIDDGRFVQFRDLDLVSEDLMFTFVGEVSTSEDELYYTVDQEEKTVMEEQQLVLEQSEEEWVSFEIEETLPDEIDKEADAPIITIYGKTEEGDIINPNYIPIDLHME